MCIKIGLFSAAARARVSVSRTCHATGVSAWRRTYGLSLSPARFRKSGKAEAGDEAEEPP